MADIHNFTLHDESGTVLEIQFGEPGMMVGEFCAVRAADWPRLERDAALGRAVREALNRGYWTASDLRLRTETPSIHSLLIAIADAIDAEEPPA